MSDSDKPELPTPSPPEPASPASTGAEKPPIASPPTAKPGAPGRPGKGKPRGGGGGDMPNRRVREPVSFEDEMRFSAGPKIRDLDAEIAGELEAALSGLGDKELMGAETSQQARGQSDGGRKQGRVLSIHGAD